MGELNKVIQFIDPNMRIPSEVIYRWLTQPTVSYWKKKGYIKPSLREGHGGFRDWWSIYDIFDIRVMLALKEKGLSTQKVGQVINWLKKHDYCLHDAVIATDGINVWHRLDEQTIEIINASAGQVILLKWQDIVKDVMEVIENETGKILKIRDDVIEKAS